MTPIIKLIDQFISPPMLDKNILEIDANTEIPNYPICRE